MTKKKQSNIIKNVLADPYDSFWPYLKGEEQETLSDLMKRFLPLAKSHRGFISHKNLRAIHKEKSKERRKILWKTMKVTPGVSEEEIAKNKENRKALVLGINGVAKAIEHSKVACCVVCGESSGRPLVQHIVMSAAQHKVPVIVLNNLRQTTSKYLGHSCAVFALKKEVSQIKEHLFHPLYEAIKSSAQKFSIPEQLMVSSSDDDSDKNDTIKEIKTEKFEVNKLPPIREFVYLTRNPGSKAFVPKPIIKKQSTIGLGDYAPLDVNDRLGTANINMEFSDNSDDDEDTIIDNNQLPAPEGRDLFFIDKGFRPPVTSLKRKIKSSHKLKPLAVKRMKGNPKKLKKKLKKN